MIVAVDFDGTLHKGTWPDIGRVAPYAKEMLRKIKEDGHYVILYTCREGDDLVRAINWLLQEGIVFDRVNDNHPNNVCTHGNNSRKVYADVYIDDRQVGGLPTWLEIYQYISNPEAL